MFGNSTIPPPYCDLMTYLVPIDDLGHQLTKLEKSGYRIHDLRIANEHGDCFWLTAVRLRDYAVNVLTDSDEEMNEESDDDSLNSIDHIVSLRKANNTPSISEKNVDFIWNETKKDFEERKCQLDL